MTFDQSLVDELNRALNEADVRGLHHEPRQNVVRLLLEVSALPPNGPIDPDPRRALVLDGVNPILVWLARDRVDGDGDRDGGALPIASLDALEEFSASLRWSHSMYGWEFIDVDDPNRRVSGRAQPRDDGRRSPGCALAAVVYRMRQRRASGPGGLRARWSRLV
jgi:hypothetical protein